METIDKIVAGLTILRYYNRTNVEVREKEIFIRTSLSENLISVMAGFGWECDRENYKIYILTD